MFQSLYFIFHKNISLNWLYQYCYLFKIKILFISTLHDACVHYSENVIFRINLVKRSCRKVAAVVIYFVLFFPFEVVLVPQSHVVRVEAVFFTRIVVSRRERTQPARHQQTCCQGKVGLICTVGKKFQKSCIFLNEH